MTKKCKLPKKLSDLVDLALDDLEKIEKTRGYEIDMGEWHRPDARRGTCAVCLAGAVMARTCGVPRDENVLPSDFGTTVKKKLDFLDFFRGAPLDAVLETEVVRVPEKLRERLLGWVDSEESPFRDTVHYGDHPKKFKKITRHNAEVLRKLGL